MARNPEADLVAQLVGDPAEADLTIGVVGDQVITATPADVGKVVTVAGDGTLVLAAGTAGGIQSIAEGDDVDVDATDPDNPVVGVVPDTFVRLPAVAPTSAAQILGLSDDDPLTTDWVDPPSGGAIVNTDGDPGTTLYVGATDPDVAFTPVEGDVWIVRAT